MHLQPDGALRREGILVDQRTHYDSVVAALTAARHGSMAEPNSLRVHMAWAAHIYRQLAENDRAYRTEVL